MTRRRPSSPAANRRAAPMPTAGTTTPSAWSFCRKRPDVRRRVLHRDHLRRSRQLRGQRAGNLHRQRRERQRPARLRPQVRRDRAGGHRRPTRTATERRRLVQPRRQLRHRRQRRDVRHRRLRAGHLRRPGLRHRIDRRRLPGPGGERGEPLVRRSSTTRRHRPSRGARRRGRPTPAAGTTIRSRSRSRAPTNYPASRRAPPRPIPDPTPAPPSVPGTCTDRAGNVSPSAAFPLRYDATKPIVTDGQAGRVAGCRRLVQPRRRRRLQRHRSDGRDRRLRDADLRRPGQRHRVLGRHLLGPRREREQPVLLPAQVRRDRPGGHGRRSGPRRQCQRLVQPLRRLHDPRYRRHVGRGRMPRHDIQRAGQRDGFGHGRLPRPRGQLRQPRVRAQVRRDCADRDRPACRRAKPGQGRLVQRTRSRSTFSGTDGLSGVDSCSSATYAGPDSDGRLGVRHVHRQGRERQRPAAGTRSSTTRRRLRSPAAAGSREANAEGWYNSAVTIGFAGTDPVSGVDLCTSTTYGGPDNAAARSAEPAPTRPATRAARSPSG